MNELENTEKIPTVVGSESKTELTNVIMAVKDIGEAWIESNEENSKRQYEIEMIRMKYESKRFWTDRSLLGMLVVAVITLSLFDALTKELAIFLTLLIGYLLKFEPLKKLTSLSKSGE